MKIHLEGGKELIPWLAAWHLCTEPRRVRVDVWVPALLPAPHHLPPLAWAALLLLPFDVLP